MTSGLFHDNWTLTMNPTSKSASNSHGMLPHIVSAASVVVSLIVLIFVRDLASEVSGLKKAVWGLPENISKKAAQKAASEPIEPSQIVYEPDFKLIHGVWSDDFVSFSERPGMMISETGVICFGISKNPKWNFGILSRVDDHEWTIDIRPYMTPKDVDETSGQECVMKLILIDPDTIQVRFDSKRTMKDHFADHGEKFVRWTVANEKTRLKAVAHGN